jgi:hypothetical protein
VPTTGQATYNVSLIGADTVPGSTTVDGIAGSGQMKVNFASGSLALTGTLSGIYNTAVQPFSSTATIASNGALTGNFQIGATASQTGALTGNFYGPAAQEVGAAFSDHWTDGSGYVATGVILGRVYVPPVPGTSFSQLNGIDNLTGDGVRPFYGSVLSTPAAMNAQITVDSASGLASVGLNGPIIANSAIASDQFVQSAQTTASTMADVINAIPPTTGPQYILPGQLYVLSSPQTDYVRAVAWIYPVNEGAGDPFGIATIGFATPVSSIPLTGFAGFAVDVDAINEKPGGVRSEVVGTGTIGVEFATGQVTTIGTLNTTGGTGPSSIGSWYGVATLSGSDGTMAGRMTVAGGTSATGFYGLWQGRLYGPNATEVGAVFNLGGVDGLLSGTMIGAYDGTITDSPATLANPGTAFPPVTENAVAIAAITDSTQTQINPQNTGAISYDTASNTYTVTLTNEYLGSVSTTSSTIALNSANADAANSNATFAAYSGPNYTARMFNTGSGNPVIQLSYTTFASVTQTLTEPGSSQSYPKTTYILYGLPTQSLSMPTSGTASYSGVAYGSGTMVGNTVDVTGTGTMSANFGAGTISATLNLHYSPAPNYYDVPGSDTITYQGVISGNSFSTNANRTVNSNANYPATGSFAGTFNGPAANEVGATWALQYDTISSRSNLAGVFVGKKN